MGNHLVDLVWLEEQDCCALNSELVANLRFKIAVDNAHRILTRNNFLGCLEFTLKVKGAYFTRYKDKNEALLFLFWLVELRQLICK